MRETTSKASCAELFNVNIKTIEAAAPYLAEADLEDGWRQDIAAMTKPFFEL